MRIPRSIVKRDSTQFAAACDVLLQAGAKIRFRANGRSMRPNILDDDAVIVVPCRLEDLRAGDVALTRNSDGFRVHRVASNDSLCGRIITRSDATQEDDPATGTVLGKVVALERYGLRHSLAYPGQKYLHAARALAFRCGQAAAMRAARLASASAFFAAVLLVGLLFSAAPAAAQTDLAVTVDTAAPSPIAPLGQITYTVTVINNGPRTANVPSVTMNTPAGTTYASAALTNNTGGGTWNLTNPGVGNTGAIKFTRSANMPNGSTASFTFTVQLTAGAVSPIAQSVTISSTTADTNNANNTATSSVTIQTPNVSVTSADAPDPVDAGGNITYTQAVKNSSTTTPAINLTFNENVPANTTYQSITIPTGWTCPTLPTVGGTGAIACTAATLAANTTSTFTVVVQVNATVASGSTITDSVTIGESGTDPGTTNASTNTTVTIPDLSVTDGAAPNPVATGANITFTQVVTNNTANTAAVGATLTEVTPANTNFVSIAAGTGWTCPTQPAAGGRGSIVCAATGTFGGTTGSASPATFTLVVSVSPETTVGSSITNSVTVSATGTDPTPGNNTATASTIVQGADLSMTQVASVTAIAPGNNITYTETVTNNGPNAATGATLYQQTPVNTTFVSMTPPTGWTCPTVPAANGTGQVICTASATMAANTTTGNFAFVVAVGAGTAAGTVISNQADVTSQTTDGNSANNGTFTSVLVEISADADVSVTMTALPTPVFISSALSYTIQVSNLGLAAATGVTVTDTLPFTGTSPNQVSALSNVTASSTQGTCTVNTTTYPFTVSCNLGGVAYPLAVPITITISGTTPATPLTLSNEVSVSSASADPVAPNNSATVLTVVQPLVCAKPGNDGAQGSLSGIVNAYYPPASAGTVAAGAVQIALGPAAAGGAQTNINAGDLLLIIQMQGAQINSTNTTSYGDGIPGDPFGYIALGATGMFEFVTATNSVVTASGGGTLTFTGTGANNGLLNSYTSAAATATQGIQTFQVIRVPQYSSATLSPTTPATALAWNGATGGVLALDIASQLTLNGGSVVLDGLGFRGGAGITERGITGFLKTDTVDASPTALPNLSGGGDPPAGGGAGGGKGEGIAGTPHWVAPSISTITHPSTASSTAQAVVEGYPNGSFARGAPGNAGGGATDADPTANDQNSGGGGAGNGGQGGLGGFGWNTAGLVGGYGGAPFPVTTSALVMGGGGGGGTSNNGSYWDVATDTGNADCGLNCTGVYSSGGAGGGIVIIHAGSVVGTGTISSNGQTALEPENDGGGGGGAGGTIFLFANSGGLSGVTASAGGGDGGNTWPESGPGTFPGNRHGAGGGGGGGVIFSTAALNAASSVANGIPGWSTLANDPYGATPGLPGVLNSGLTNTQTPGVQSGAYCAGADISVSNTGSPNPVLAGGTITYNQGIVNNGPLDALNATFSEVIPANTTFASLNFPGGSNGWSCTTPAAGAAGTISCNNADVASGVSTAITVAVTVAAGATPGTVITDVVNGASGTNDPNLINNSATVQTTVALAGTADLALTNVALSDSNSTTIVVPTNLPTYNGNITYTQTVTNNGPSAASNVVLTEAIPTNSTFVSATPSPAAGWTCNVVSGTLTCSANTGVLLNAGASETFTVVVNVASGVTAGTTITDTAQVSSTTTDPNPNNNSATTVLTVATAGQSDLSVTSTASPNPITDGNNITYTQFVTNNGPVATSGTATFTDAIPAGTSFVSFTVPSGWNCGTLPAVGATSGTITCTIASLPVNAGTPVAFPLVVKALLGDPSGTAITNTANINVPCSSITDPNCGNNSASTTVVVASPTQAYIGITKTASPEPVDQNTTLTYTIQITNNGPALAQNVVVNDPLPSQVTYASVSTTQGTCTYTAATTTVNCSLGSVSVGGLVIINIDVTANTFSSSTLATNTATVTSTTGDANPSNSATVISTIAAPTAVQIASFRAIPRQGGGVLVEWRTREEVRNLGFNLFRMDGAARQRVNPSIIAGSALLIRGGAPQHSAKTYQWVDLAGTPQSTYELEDVDLNGTRMPHGPIMVDLSAAPGSGAIKRPLLLTQLSSAMARPVISTPHLMPIPRPILPPRPIGAVPTTLDGDAAVKISVESEGWYQVSKAELVAAGLDPNVDVRFLQLFAEGFEQPMQILGARSGPLGPDDSIEFYGTGIDTPFSGTRVYWLVEGKGPGKRIRSIQPAVNGFSPPESFRFTTILEQRTTYFGTLLNGDSKDNFFGDAVTSAPVDEQLTVAHADPNSSIPVSVDITLQGATDQQPHSVSVSFNGASIGAMNFSNLANFTQNFPIDPSLLQDGANVVELTALDGDNDVSVVQSVALHYPHTYTADGDWLKATASAESKLHVTGFSSAQITAFDITDPLNILQLQGQIEQEGSTYSMTLAAPRSAVTQRTILCFANDQISVPAALSFHQPAALTSERNGAQMVIVTHPDFAAALPPLVQFHQSQGMTVQVVSIDEIFDAFNYGERSPFAVRSFLQNAVAKWSTKPQYLLLMGDASLDPRNYLGLGDFDFVPTRIIETQAFKTSSDDWFSDFNQSGFATIATGRIPADTLADAQTAVSKILAYASGPANAANPQALLVADQNVGADFTDATKFAANNLPAALQPTEIFADGQDPAVVSQQIVAALSAGPLLVNYSGHGSEQQWSFEDLLDNSSAAALSNSSQPSVYILMDCLNGFFQDVYAQSLAEALLLAPNGGAAAVWASSGFTNQPPQAVMNQALLQSIKMNPSITLGTAILNAKSGVADPDVRRSWIFFGDPAMSLQSASAAANANTGPSGSTVPIIHPRVPKRSNPPITKTPY